MMVLDLRAPNRIFRSVMDTPFVGSNELADLNTLLGQLFAEEATNLVRLARFFVDDRTAAEDLVQEAFIRLSRSAHRVQDQEKIKPYLRSIVLNLARDHNRRGLMSLRHRPPTDPEPPGLDDQVAADDDRRVVIAALRQIAPGQRNVLVLRYYMELSVAETAATLGVSVNTVKTQQQRGLASLAQLLGGDHDDT
jgi:RNA polymerase sigma-70 factor (sigma-E family)